MERVDLSTSLLVRMLITFLMCCLIIPSSEMTAKKKDYKSRCETDTDCDESQSLYCDKFSYLCSCPKSTTWDIFEHSCRTKEGQNCKINLQLRELYGRNTFEKCVSNTSCIAGKCECDNGFLRNNFGTCDLSYGMPCSSGGNSSLERGSICAWRFLLECSRTHLQGHEGVCKCNKEGLDYMWDPVRAKCVSFVGSGCDMDFENRADDKLECVENALCANKICECRPGYSVTPDKKCLLEYGQQCDNTEGRFCNRYKLLNCGDDGKCGCEFYGQMVYDERFQECRMLAGEFCDLPEQISSSSSGWNVNVNRNSNTNTPTDKSRIHRCVKDAQCTLQSANQRSGRNSKGKCTCVPGKFQAEDNTCSNVRGHGHPCNFGGDCNQTAFLTCMIDENGGHCECIPNDMYFDTRISQCVSLPGKSCMQKQICSTNSICNDDEFCACKDGYDIPEDGTVLCVPIQIEDCNTTSTTSSTEIQEPKPETAAPAEVDDQKSSLSSSEEEKPQVLNYPSLLPPYDNFHTVFVSRCAKIPLESVDYKRCQCGLHTHSESRIWSEERQKCLKLVGSVCEDDEVCTENARCDEDKTCQCLEESRTTVNRTCVVKMHHHHQHQPQLGSENQNQDHDIDKEKFNPLAPEISHGEAGRNSATFWSLLFSNIMALIVV